MKRLREGLAAFIFATMLTLPLIAVLGTTACNTDQTKKAAAAAQDIKNATALALEVKRDLLSQGLITNALAIEIDKVIIEIDAADRTFVQGVQQFKDGKITKAQLIDLFGKVNAAIGDLNSKGVLQISDPKARATLQSVLDTLSVAAGIIQGVLGSL